jgi:hypothetical protein
MEEALPIQSVLSEIDLPAVHPDQGIWHVWVSDHL